MKTKTYIVSEQILVCYEVEAKNEKEARQKYLELSHADFQDLMQQALENSCASVNVREVSE